MGGSWGPYSRVVTSNTGVSLDVDGDPSDSRLVGGGPWGPCGVLRDMGGLRYDEGLSCPHRGGTGMVVTLTWNPDRPGRHLRGGWDPRRKWGSVPSEPLPR